MTAVEMVEIEERLQAAFASEIAHQRGRCPSLEPILLMARIEERLRVRSKLDRTRACCEALALSGSTGLLALFWSDLTSGLQSLLPQASYAVPSTTALGLVASLLALLLFRRKTYENTA